MFFVCAFIVVKNEFINIMYLKIESYTVGYNCEYYFIDGYSFTVTKHTFSQKRWMIMPKASMQLKKVDTNSFCPAHKQKGRQILCGFL
jgi:hypothetical protein